MVKLKLTAVTLIAAVFLGAAPVSASANTPKVGDFLGYAYYGDTRVYLGDNYIPSVVVDGKAVVATEDFHAYFGWEVRFDAKKRVVNIDFRDDSNVNYDDFKSVWDFWRSYPNIEEPPQGFDKERWGKAAGKVYATDIKAYFDGREMTAFNIDGRMYVLVADFRKCGYSVTWDGEKRCTTIEYEPLYVETDMGRTEIFQNGIKVEPHEHWVQRKIEIVLDGEVNRMDVVYFSSDVSDLKAYLPLKDFLAAFKAWYTYYDASFTLEVKKIGWEDWPKAEINPQTGHGNSLERPATIRLSYYKYPLPPVGSIAAGEKILFTADAILWDGRIFVERTDALNIFGYRFE